MNANTEIDFSDRASRDDRLRQIVVENTDVGTRLDVFLARRFAPSEGWTRSAIQRLIAEGSVVLNGRRAKPSARLKRADRIDIHASPVLDAALTAEALPLNILYEDDDLIVLNKAAGMVVHPAAGWKSGTLVNALLHHCPDLPGIGGECRPGIVHRLDKDTSGAMVVAKNERAFHHLAADFKGRRVRKDYLALVWGVMSKSQGAIDRPIGRHRSDRKKMSSVRALAHARAALTEWRVAEVFPSGPSRGRFAHVSLLRLRLHSGRTHQIRVHLADESHPVVGDPVYGPKPAAFRNEAVDPALSGFPRQALHAERLEFTHPVSGAVIECHAPLPQDFKSLLQHLAHGMQSSATPRKGVDKGPRLP